MSEKKIRVCDRCSLEVSSYTLITIHDHHVKAIDLCGSCRRDLSKFMRGAL